MSRRLGLSRLTWRLGLSDELAFWDSWLESEGFLSDADPQSHKDFLHRIDPHSVLDPSIIELLPSNPDDKVVLLDVGAGPLTYLGKSWPGRQVQIIAIDPLASQYDRLLRKHGVNPTVRTRFGEAENLLAQFRPDSFDLVYASNCLDHCFDPLLAIRQMIAVVKPQCFVLLIHALNEGKRQRYQGLHQWNFFVDGGACFVGSRHRTLNITEEVRASAEVSYEIGEGWSKDNVEGSLTMRVRKKPGTGS